MDITSLPTESLYKFLAFAGLLIMTVLPIYLYKMYMQVSQKIIEAETEEKIIGHQNTYFESMLKIIEQDVAQNSKIIKSVSSIDKNDVSDKLLADAANAIKANNDSLARLLEKHLEMGIAKAKFGGNVKIVRLLHDQMARLQKSLFIALFVGATMASIGFRHWYVIQGYVDQATIKEASKK